MSEATPAIPPSFGAWVHAFHQAPVMSHTQITRVQNMVHYVPSAASDLAATVRVGDRAPDFDLVSTDGRHVTMADFRGTPLVLRFTRAGGGNSLSSRTLV